MLSPTTQVLLWVPGDFNVICLDYHNFCSMAHLLSPWGLVNGPLSFLSLGLLFGRC